MKALRARLLQLKVTLWTLIAPPTVWAAHFLFCYLFVAIRCAKRGEEEIIGDIRLWIGVATVAAVVAIVVSGYIAWVQASGPGDPPPHQESSDEDRLRFLAVATLMLAGLSLIAVLYTALPALMFEDCR